MQKMLALGLSLLLLLSSTGITYAEHFCGSFKMMSKVTVGHQDLNCGMVVTGSGCDTADFKTMDCCDNHYLAIDTDDTFAKTQFNFDFNAAFQGIAIPTLELPVINFEIQTIKAVPYYRPPPNIKNLPIVYQQFLI